MYIIRSEVAELFDRTIGNEATELPSFTVSRSELRDMFDELDRLEASANNEAERNVKVANRLQVVERDLGGAQRAWEKCVSSEAQALAENEVLRMEVQQRADSLSVEIRNAARLLELSLTIGLQGERQDGAMRLVVSLLNEISTSVQMSILPADYNDIPF